MGSHLRISSICLAFYLILGLAGWADTVEMTDGRKIEGLIQSVSGVEVTVKLETGAVVRIPRSRVRTITRADWQYYVRKGDQATDPQQQLDYYRKAQELNPAAPGLTGKIRLARQRIDKQAQQRVQQEQEASRKTEDAQVLAQFQKLMDAVRPDAAREYLEKTIAEKPYLCQPRIKLAEIYERDREPQGRVRYIEVLVGLVNNDCEVYYPVFAPVLVEAAEKLLVDAKASAAMSFTLKDRLLGLVGPFVDESGRLLRAEEYRKRRGLPEKTPSLPAGLPSDDKAVDGAKTAIGNVIAAKTFPDLAESLTNESAAAVSVGLLIPAAMMAAFSDDAKLKSDFEKLAKPYGLDKEDGLDDAAALARLKAQGRRLLPEVGKFLTQWMKQEGEAFPFEYDGSKEIAQLKFTVITSTRVRIDDPSVPGEKPKEARLEDGKWRVHLGDFESILEDMGFEAEGDKSDEAVSAQVPTGATGDGGLAGLTPGSPTEVTLRKINFLKHVCLKRPADQPCVEPELSALLAYKNSLNTDEGRDALHRQVNGWSGQSSTYLMRGDMAKAAALAEMVLAFRPDSLSAQTVVAAERVKGIRRLRERNQFDLAIQNLEAAEKVLPKSPKLGAERARLYLALADRRIQRGEYQRAIECIDAAGQGTINDPQVRNAVQSAGTQLASTLKERARELAGQSDFGGAIEAVQVAAQADPNPLSPMSTRKIIGEYREKLRKYLWVKAMLVSRAERPDFSEIAAAKSEALKYDVWFARPKQGSTKTLAQDVAEIAAMIRAQAVQLDNESKMLELFNKVGSYDPRAFTDRTVASLSDKAHTWVQEGKLPLDFFYGRWVAPGILLEVDKDRWRFSGGGLDVSATNLYQGAIRVEHQPEGATAPTAYGLRVNRREGEDRLGVFVEKPGEIRIFSYSVPSPSAPDGRRTVPFLGDTLKWQPLQAPEGGSTDSGTPESRPRTSDDES